MSGAHEGNRAIAFVASMPQSVTVSETSAHIVKITTEGHYLLSSDEAEAERLNLQHRILKSAASTRQAGLIVAPVHLHASSKVLDSATGSAVWLLDVSKTLAPTVQLYGVDLSPRMFPASLPVNVHLSMDSITALPTEWAGQFALVHQRALIAALRLDEWHAALAEAFRVLEPGGWMQLEETFPFGCAGKPQTQRITTLCDRLFASRGMVSRIGAHIPSLLKHAGFVHVQVQECDISLGRWAGRAGADARNNFMCAFRRFKQPVLGAGGFGIVETEEEFDAFMDDLEHEWDEGPGAVFRMWTIIAQKPVEETWLSGETARGRS